MFKLTQAITKWRNEMAAQGVRSRDILDELENHLREDVAAQIRAGTNPAEAFRLATQRIGQGVILKREFAKLHGSNRTRLTKPFRIFCIITGLSMLLLSGWVLYSPGSGSFDEPASLFVLASLAVYTGTLPLWYKWLPTSHSKWIGILLKSVTLLVGALPLVALAGALGLPVLQLDNTESLILWSTVVTFTATIFAYACLDSERGINWHSSRVPALE